MFSGGTSEDNWNSQKKLCGRGRHWERLLCCKKRRKEEKKISDNELIKGCSGYQIMVGFESQHKECIVDKVKY